MCSFLFIWTLAVVLQEHADYYFGIDSESLRPTETVVTSFMESVHTNDPDLPAEELTVTKWVKPAVIALFGEFSDWHRQVIFEHALLLQRLTGLQISIGAPNDRSASLTIHFVKGREAFVTTVRRYTSDANWNEERVRGFACLALININARKEITSGVNVIPLSGRDSAARRCIIEELTQAFGPGSDNATYRPSMFDSRYLPDRLTINDKILVRTLYDSRIKPAMTRKETEPIAREIIEELVAAVKERGEEALYQR